MIQKMKYINIMGHISDFDWAVEKYISQYDIQLEYASKELADTHGVFAFTTVNPYNEPLRKAEGLLQQTGYEEDIYFDMAKNRALEVIDIVAEYYNGRDGELKRLEEKRDRLAAFVKQIEPFIDLEFDIETLADFKFIKYRLGKMPYGSFKQFETFLYAEQNILFVEGRKNSEDIYGIYFVTNDSKDKADSLLSSFHFERTWIPFELEGRVITGSPMRAYYEAIDDLNALNTEIREFHEDKLGGLDIKPGEVFSAYRKIKELQFYYETRKYAGKTKNDFYIIVGWMAEKDAYMLERATDNDKRVVITVEDVNEGQTSKPPTMLKNPKLFKPFEFLVKLYGLPSYHEMDPTIFIALTYSLLFGLMFGDVGQGAVFVLGGLFVYKKKGMALGAVVSVIGLASMFFGVMYGSIFGFEEMIHGIWMRPTENVNLMLGITVGLGVLLILIAMAINIINATVQKGWGKLFFSPSGVAGIVFYGGMIYLVLMIFTGSTKAMGALIVVLIVSTILITFQHPLASMLEKRKYVVHGSMVMYLLETVIELFEVMLSYFTNTLSFVRVGAFALSHAGIMSVVMMLSKTTDGGHNMVIIIIGNIVVIGFEGLVVGIQALRLEFYEMFSRFFDGARREFVPYKNKKI